MDPPQDSTKFLLVDPPSVVEKALDQVLRLFGKGILARHVKGRDAGQVAGLTGALDTEDLFLPVVAGSTVAWKKLRPVNIWNLTEGFVCGEEIFQPVTKPGQVQATQAVARAEEGGEQGKKKESLAVVPACVVDHTSLYDLVASDGNGVSNLLCTLLQPDSPASVDERNQSNLKRAALRWLAAERHDIRVRNIQGLGSHREHDVHAALRIIHGAVLAGWISWEDGRSAYQDVCTKARETELLDGEVQESAFFSKEMDMVGALLVHRPSVAPFATLLVVDDQAFWKASLHPIWIDRGFFVEQEHDPTRFEKVRHEANDAKRPVRAIILDLKFGQENVQGGSLLRHLKRTFRGVPVIVLSVEDVFSETALLKKRGAYCYLNKRSLSEERGYRDEVSAFCQLRDAVLLAGFASLSSSLKRLWRTLAEIDDVLAQGDVDGETLDAFMERALDQLVEECRHIFHATWQDTGYPRGLACRQIIRAFGLVNDKWSECWKARRFDPDYGAWNGRYRGTTWPHRSYHYITRQLRNHASHAAVRDDCFDWRDAWIAVLVLFLKVDRMARYAADPKDHSVRAADEILDDVIRTLWSLLVLSGYLEHQYPNQASTQMLTERIVDASGRLRGLLVWWRRGGFAELVKVNQAGSEYVAAESAGNTDEKDWKDEKDLEDDKAARLRKPSELGCARVGVEPYVLRGAPASYLLCEADLVHDLEHGRTDAQLRGDLLVLYLTAARAESIVSTDPGKNGYG